MSTQFYYNQIPSDALNVLLENDEAFDILIDAFDECVDEQKRLNTFPGLVADVWKDCQEGFETNVPYALHHFLTGNQTVGGYIPGAAPDFLVGDNQGLLTVNAVFGRRLLEYNDHVRYLLSAEVQEVSEALSQILKSNLSQPRQQFGIDIGEGGISEIRELAKYYSRVAENKRAILITISD